jgi:hypothetical protein
MPWAALIAIAASTALGFGLGWPLGFIAAAGCLLIPFAVVQLLLRLFPPRFHRPPQQQPLRVVAVRITNPGEPIARPSQPAITQRNP